MVIGIATISIGILTVDETTVAVTARVEIYVFIYYRCVLQQVYHIYMYIRKTRYNRYIVRVVYSIIPALL